MRMCELENIYDAWAADEFVLDPTRITLLCGSAGFDGTQFKGLLASRFDIQLNKTHATASAPDQH